MHESVSSWGGRLVFAYLPSRERLEDPSSANPHRDGIVSLVRGLGIPVVDLLDTLSGHPDPLSLFPFRVENHLTAEGYGLIAGTLITGLDSLDADRQVPE